MPLDAKRDERVKGSAGQLLSFEYFGESWPLEPQSLFYNWLYLTALTQGHNERLLSQVLEYDAFTDIEFNPEKSVSCQAASAAIAVSLAKVYPDLRTAVSSRSFRKLMVAGSMLSTEGQARLF
jgi:type I restriction enzyme M protein